MKPEFHEDQVKGLDALDGRSIDFPWEEVLARLDGEPMLEDVRAELRRKCAEGLLDLLRWLIRGDGRERLYVRGQVSGCRAIALAWVLSPDLFDGTPSLRALADRLGVPVSSLSHHTADASKRWGVFNRAQARYNKSN